MTSIFFGAPRQTPELYARVRADSVASLMGFVRGKRSGWGNVSRANPFLEWSAPKSPQTSKHGARWTGFGVPY